MPTRSQLRALNQYKSEATYFSDSRSQEISNTANPVITGIKGERDAQTGKMQATDPDGGTYRVRDLTTSSNIPENTVIPLVQVSGANATGIADSRP